MSKVPNASNYRFDDFFLDVANRQLWRGPTRLDLTARYFDALVLLVRQHGQLVEKEQFFAEVWSGVIVGDSALTQAIKEIRKQLGDDAANPRYVQTVPRYGYRFVGTVEPIIAVVAADPAPVPAAAIPVTPAPAAEDAPREKATLPWRNALVQTLAGTLGGGMAGVLGGLFYGCSLAAAANDARVGTASLLLVLISLNVFVGLAGGLGVSGGFVLGGLTRRYQPLARIIGAATGGMLVGGLAKLLGIDAFNLLFGRAPAGITGGFEGAALGAALAMGMVLISSRHLKTRRRSVIGAGLAGAVAGLLIPFAGGHLMGGSLELLARSFADSRLPVDALGRLFGEVHFGRTAQAVLAGLEGLLFGSCVAGGLVIFPSTPAERGEEHPQ